MIKRISLFFIFIVLVSCFHRKNEYKKIRFNSVGLSPYKEKMILEDSSNIFIGYYKLEAPRHSNENIINNKEIRKTYLVFYNNGKVARFLDYEEENLDLNPKKAEMGYYGKKGEKKYIKFKYLFQGKGHVLESEIVFISKDSIILSKTYKISNLTEKHKYIKVLPENEIKNFKPDW